MASAVASDLATLRQPPLHSIERTGRKHRGVGVAAAVLGWGLVAVGFIISLTAAAIAAQGGADQRPAALEVLAFGIAVAGLGTGKTGIALILWGILHRIWARVASVKAALPGLVPATETPTGRGLGGIIETPYGAASITARAPAPLFIHRMARALWAPMLVMGAMALYAGLLVSFSASRQAASSPEVARSLHAWVQGLQFLGEGFLLSAISFFLGTILGAIRTGGGEVQESLGVTVKTLLMPRTTKAFVGLMMVGLMVEVVQFILYVNVAWLTDAGQVQVYSTWLAPLREFGLGILLSGIALALATIARALDLQFARIRELIATGR